MVASRSRVGTMFGRYKITRMLGKGGMGEVYEAHDTTKDRVVALKILPDEYASDQSFRRRFERESHVTAQLQEPHVIPIHDWGDIDGSLFIDMRLVDGSDLRTLIRKGPLEPARAVSIVGQISAALDAAHAQRLIHRDVKPENIIVTPADFAYLVDFGIAEAHGDTRLTMAGTTIGSFVYMAPERFVDAAVTSAVDVYSLACVLFEALTGDAPFPAVSNEQLIACHLSTPPPRPSVVNPNVPSSFDEVIARGMAKEPDDRYASPGALARAAQRALRSPGVTAPASNATLPAPQAFRSTAAPTRQDPRFGPPPPTPVVPPHRLVETSAPRWLLPAIIAIVVAVLVGVVGIVIGLLAGRNSGQVAGTSTTTAESASPSTVYRTGSPQVPTVAPTTRPLALPPLVTGPDNRSVSCDQGYAQPNASGFGSHARRGTPDTSCFFAQSVLNAYWAQYGRPGPERRDVTARGSVDCGPTGGRCAGTDFIMECSKLGADDWITCTGGDNARVYLY